MLNHVVTGYKALLFVLSDKNELKRETSRRGQSPFSRKQHDFVRLEALPQLCITVDVYIRVSDADRSAPADQFAKDIALGRNH